MAPGAPTLMPPCGALYTAPLAPGSKYLHIWLCELPVGHSGPHASPFRSLSATITSRPKKEVNR